MMNPPVNTSSDISRAVTNCVGFALHTICYTFLLSAALCGLGGEGNLLNVIIKYTEFYWVAVQKGLEIQSSLSPEILISLQNLIFPILKGFSFT